jgi:hypothetical protein
LRGPVKPDDACNALLPDGIPAIKNLPPFSENYRASPKLMTRSRVAPDTLTGLQTSGNATLEDDMSEIFKLLPTTLARLSVDDPFLSVAALCGVGMLASLLALAIDQDLFNMWVYP